MKRERRVLRGVEIRATKDGKLGISGYAAVFGEMSEPMYGFRERIAPGAFARALRDEQDVRALQNHDPNLLLGRTKSGTLRMKEDSKGLKYDVDLPDTQAARDLHALIDRGDVDQCSFSFTAQKQTWIDEKDEQGQMRTIRELNDVDLFDVGPVTFPAYPQTSVSIRSLWPDGVPEDVGSHVPELRAKTKKVDGVDLTSDCFAFVGDPEDPKTWKLPIKFPGDEEKTKSHIRNALARFGQTKGIPSDKKKSVYAKIVAAAKKYGIKVAEGDSIRHAQYLGITVAAVRAMMETSPDPDDAELPECECDCAGCSDGDCNMCDREGCDDEDCGEAGCPMQGEGPEGSGGRSAIAIARAKARIAEIEADT